jgi:yecA family protein
MSRAKDGLTDQELNDLKFFLDRNLRAGLVDDGDGSLLGIPLIPFEGFITGIISGPDLIQPKEWVPMVIGYVPRDDAATIKALTHALDLIVLRYNALAEMLAERPREFRPHIAADDGTIDELAAVAWALGYLRAISLRQESWRRLTHGPDAPMLRPMVELAQLGPQLQSKRGVSAAAEARASGERLPAAVAKIYAYWSTERVATAGAAEVRRVAAPRVRKAKPRRAPAVKTKDVFDLRITLAGIAPPIWRLVAVPTEIPLGALHLTIQGAMGWRNQHLHSFQIGGKTYEDGRGSRTPLERMVVEGDCFRYVYDFGDHWVHDVVVERRYGVKSRRHYPKCLDGARAGPPENCGGIPGYERLLAALADVTASDHEELTRWAQAFWWNAAHVDGPKPDLFNAQTATWDIQGMLMRD